MSRAAGGRGAAPAPRAVSVIRRGSAPGERNVGAQAQRRRADIGGARIAVVAVGVRVAEQVDAWHVVVRVAYADRQNAPAVEAEPDAER